LRGKRQPETFQTKEDFTMGTAVSKTNESKSAYLMDPASAGVTLGVPGMPTEEGWKWVTPEMWKFRWSVADKIQVAEPDFYKDKDWYVDCTRANMVAEEVEKNPNILPADLAADTIIRYLDTQNLNFRPYEVLLGLAGNDEHGIVFDLTGHAWTALTRLIDLAGSDKLNAWENGEKVPIDDKKFQRLKKAANSFNAAVKVKDELSETDYKAYFCMDPPGRYFEPIGALGQRSNPDHDWYLDLGLKKVVELKRKRMDWFEQELKNATGDRVAELKNKIVNSKATLRTVEAAMRWIKRHATEARKAIPNMPDARAKAMLERSAAACDWVSENAPRTFIEAMQLHWLCFLIEYSIECSCGTLTFLPDRIFWKWYEKDVLNDKTLSRLEAGEFLACYAAKYHELGGTMSRFGGLEKAGQGSRDFSTLTIGGVKGDGSDAVNDLTMLYLDVWDGYRLHFPDIKFRWCTKTKRAPFKRLIEVMRSGMGTPSIRNDDVVIPALLAHYPRSLNLEEARSWGIVGCNNPGPSINSKGACRRESQYSQVTKAVEFALFNGRDPQSGFEWFKSIETGDATKFKTYDEFHEAWRLQWEWIVTTELRLRVKMHEKLTESSRRPFVSALYKGCMETGDDIMELDLPRFSFQTIVGWIDSIDSLAAVKYCVYEEKKYTIAQLQEALKADWVGYDKMRDDFKKAPKFGNDNELVDAIMCRATDDVYQIGRQLKDSNGDPVFLNAVPVSMMYMAAPCIGALPNGRKRGEALCDGALNPHAEFDMSGPWARMNSSLKVDQTKFQGHIINTRFDYSSVEGEAGLNKLIDLSLAALNGGMSQLQYNFISQDMLHDARKHPEKYPYLSVRVSGYTAFFVGLPEFMQDAIMQRVDHRL
jgi:pyruvate-formate lyase